MPGLSSMLDLGSLPVTLLVFFVWSITPMSWAYIVATLAAHYIDVPVVLPLLPLPQWTRSQLLHPVLLTWSIVEALFSIYYAYLIRRVQKRGPAPMYGRRFLRMVFSRALESGMSLDKREATLSTMNDNRERGGRELRSRRANQTSTASQQAERPPPNPLATKRLRAASYLPRFVEQEPLHRDDPRAKEFAQQQAMWFPGSKVEDITRRDAERWLAWSLYGSDLEELEAEREEMVSRGGMSSASHERPNGISKRLHPLHSLTTEPPLPPSSPIPAARGTFAQQIHDTDASEESDTLDLDKEDKRGVRAVPGEWDADPVRGDRLEFLHYCRELIEARQGFVFEESPPDWTPRKCMRLTLDPVVVSHRPLLLYLVVNAVSYVTLIRAKMDGFKVERQGRIRYLIYRPPQWTPELAKREPSKYRPIVFLHGLGIGLGQYAALVRHLRHTPLTRTHPLLIPLQPHISQAIFDPTNHLTPFKHHEFTALLRRVFKRERWTQSGVTVLSHSNGTMLHSWLLKSAGDFVKRSCFVDPVCLQLWVPHIVGNFLYAKPKSGVMHLIAYFVAKELGTANMLFRHFDWSSCLLWPQDEIPNITDPHCCQIYLAEDDAIVNAPETRRYLRQFGLKERSDLPGGEEEKRKANLHFVRHAAHGEVLMAGGKMMKDIVEWLDEPDPSNK